MSGLCPPSAHHDLHILNSAHQHTNSASLLTPSVHSLHLGGRGPDGCAGGKFQRPKEEPEVAEKQFDTIFLKLPSNNYLHQKEGIPFTGNVQKLAEHLSGVL